MNITLLGHHDIASLYALDRVIGLLQEHRWSVLLSRDADMTSVGNASLAALQRVDADLCDRFLSGDIRGPIATELTATPFAVLDNPNSLQGLRILEELQPDLIVSIRYRRILRDAAIAIPGQGVLNLHSGILPEYRGVMATFWAMLAGEREIGSTLHWIVDNGIDTGPLIRICRRAMRPERSYLANVLGLYAEGCDVIAEAVREIAAGRKPPGVPQAGEGQYFGMPEAHDLQRFDASGLALFDGSEAAEIQQ